MGAPYNQLQQLVFSYSGREIGIDKFKPYTFGNEKANVALNFYGGMLQMPTEQARTQFSLQSGRVEGGLSDKGFFRATPSGRVTSAPNDLEKIRIGITGLKNGMPFSLNELDIYITGQITHPQADVFANFGVNGFSGRFTGDAKEIVNYQVYQSGELLGVKTDSFSMTFQMFTGIYNSGLYIPPPQNYPLTGEDSQSMSFIFFTGTYQGS